MMDKIKSPNFLEFIYGFYNTMKEREISLAYEGEINHQVTKAFTSLAETNMETQMEEGGVQRKVFHVMVECLQNINKHADKTDDGREGRGIFIVTKGEEEYNVITGNLVDALKQESLKASIDRINNMNKDELKELYKRQMKGGTISEKGCAGLGFIDIVRKTGNKLKYDFLPVSDKCSFFILIVAISRAENNNSN